MKNNFSNKLKNICGRSMIEMLGVLAIIGVLSAGGIMGYSVAMENHNVNKIAEELQSMAAKASYVFGKTPKVANNYNMEQMHQLGIISDKVYNAPLGINASYRKIYGVELYFSLRENAGDSEFSAPRTEVWMWSWLPKTMCVKLLTYNWKGTGVIANNTNHTKSWALSKYINLPASVSAATTMCTNKTADKLTWVIWHIPLSGKSK